MENVIFKCCSNGGWNDESLFIKASLIRKIRPVRNEDYTKLFVEYYDEEFCVNSTFICDYIEPMDII